ncbi:TRAP transporter substrate-binding protein DctP, partial [Salmonella enterica]|uniref:TRAP transporter substrate-binding protein DctP n=1 Tax=Salmonella enterica TaxID=28901 RepID=UPI000A3E6D31
PQVMEPVYQSTAAPGFVGVGWYDSGARNFYMSNAPVKRLEDLRGKKIRVMQSEPAIQTLKLLGASPIAMRQAAAHTPLQQGIL